MKTKNIVKKVNIWKCKYSHTDVTFIDSNNVSIPQIDYKTGFRFENLVCKYYLLNKQFLYIYYEANKIIVAFTSTISANDLPLRSMGLDLFYLIVLNLKPETAFKRSAELLSLLNYR